MNNAIRAWFSRFERDLSRAADGVTRATASSTQDQHRERGMTLIEILVVLTLIGVVLGIVGGNYISRGEQAKAKAAKIEIGQIAQTLDLYKLEVGRYPTSQEGLQALITAPPSAPNWNGPYWKKNSLPKDPWGNEYRYTAPGQSGPYDILSYGADGKEGGEGVNADITNKE